MLTREEVLAQLTASPGLIEAATRELTPERLSTSPAAGEWSMVEVLAHLRSCADVWGAAIARMIDEDEPTIRAVNPQTYIDETDYREQDFKRSLRAFTRQRTKLLALLSPADWSRGSIVTGAGSPLSKSILSYGQRMARHERAHVNHIARFARNQR
jgi:hypothetical protein